MTAAPISGPTSVQVERDAPQPLADTHPSPPPVRATWPLHRHQAILLSSGWAVLTLLWVVIGKLIVGPLDDSAVVRTDKRVANWMVGSRTPTWDRLTVWGSYLAETVTKVAVTAIVALAMLWVWRRWFEPLLLAVSLIVEAAAFIVATTIIGRERPDVPRLEESPVGSSFPSGHAAAAAAYIAIAIVVFWHTRKVWPRVLAVVITALVPVIVSLSRMYRGMHFLSDTIFGVILGCGSVLLTALVLRRSAEGERVLGGSKPVGSTEPHRTPEQVGERMSAPSTWG